jgi:hypothetical protein
LETARIRSLLALQFMKEEKRSTRKVPCFLQQFGKYKGTIAKFVDKNLAIARKNSDKM